MILKQTSFSNPRKSFNFLIDKQTTAANALSLMFVQERRFFRQQFRSHFSIQSIKSPSHFFQQIL